MKNFLIIIGLETSPCATGSSTFAEDAATISQQVQPKPAVNPITVAQNIMFENCTKIFGVNQEKLFYLTLASISANRFNIDEIQYLPWREWDNI